MTFELSESPKPEYFSGIAKLEVKPTFNDCLTNRFTSYDTAQKVEPEKYSPFLQDLGLVTSNVEIRLVNSLEDSARSYLAIRSQFVRGVDVVQLVDTDTLQRQDNNDPYKLEDIVFVANDTGRAFSLKSILGEKKILIDPKLQKGYGDENSVRFLPIGATEAPKNPIWKFMRHYYKNIEGAIMLHEVAHTEQRLQEIAEKGGIEKMGSLWIEKYQGLALAERDAWRFALQGIRQLRQKGINLIPDLTNQQIIDHIELALMGYDRGYPYPMYRRYSRKIGQPREKLPSTVVSFVSPIYYTAKSWIETAKIIVKNPSIITQGLKSEID